MTFGSSYRDVSREIAGLRNQNSTVTVIIFVLIFFWQEEVFGAVGKKIVEGCVAGYNGTIFA